MGLTAPTVTKENPNEMYFRWYLEELERFGFIKKFKREAELISIFPAMYHRRERHLKVKENVLDTVTMFQATNYTYDFRVIWNERALNLFTEVYDHKGHFKFGPKEGKPIFVSHMIEIDGEIEIVSYIDVKPHFAAAQFGGGKNASYYTFPYIQKYLFLSRKLYINKAIPIHTGKHGRSTCLFATTFVPNKYLFTDKSGKLRAIPYPKKSITSFVTQREGIIANLIKQKKGKEENKNSQQNLF